jgi:hypothetical protein
MAAVVIAYTRIAAADNFMATKAPAISFTGRPTIGTDSTPAAILALPGAARIGRRQTATLVRSTTKPFPRPERPEGRLLPVAAALPLSDWLARAGQTESTRIFRIPEH